MNLTQMLHIILSIFPVFPCARAKITAPLHFAHHKMQYRSFEGGIILRIFVEGQDARAAYLAEMLRNKGHETADRPPYDLMILSIPRTSISGEELRALPKEQRILCGLSDPAFDALAKEKEWRLFPVLKDTQYTQENAILSAEGALYYAMRQADFSIRHAQCMILGYGRIGKALTHLLREMGANGIVAARRPESRLEAGENSIALDEIPRYLPHIQLLFNTIPAPVIGKEWLGTANKDALLIELASPPYGIDLAAAQEMGLRAWGEWGIPGRYCPKSAAALIMDYLEREVFL